MSDAGGLGNQETRERVQAAIDAGRLVVDESKRRNEPSADELADPLLAECRRAADAFREAKRIAEYPDKWDRLNVRNAALSAAEHGGHSLRAIARVTGMTHVGVRGVIAAYRSGHRYSRRPAGGDRGYGDDE